MVAVLLSLVSAVAYAAGAIIQEHVAATVPARPYAPLRHSAWWLAVALNGTGAVLHVVALAYGPLSVVQPLGALTIVFALPLAAVFAGRRAGVTAWQGALMATAGLAGLLALSGDTDTSALGTGQRGVLAAATFGVVALVFLVAQTIHRPVLRSVLLAASAGVAFGIASVFTKNVAVGWQWSSPFAEWSSMVVIAVLATAGLLLSQASYRGAGLAAPLATVTVVNPVVAAAVGVAMFGETFRYGIWGAVLASAFGVVAAAGLVRLTREQLAATRRREAAHAAAARRAPEVRSAPAAGSRGPARTPARHGDGGSPDGPAFPPRPQDPGTPESRTPGPRARTVLRPPRGARPDARPGGQSEGSRAAGPQGPGGCTTLSD
jgi:drug/metabolite transporter (DMT)-like permease